MWWVKSLVGNLLRVVANIIGIASLFGLFLAMAAAAVPESEVARVMSGWPLTVVDFIRYGQGVPSWPVGLAFITLVFVAWIIGVLGEWVELSSDDSIGEAKS